MTTDDEAPGFCLPGGGLAVRKGVRMRGKLIVNVGYFGSKFEAGTEFEIATPDETEEFVESLSMPVITRKELAAGATVGRLGDRFRLVDQGAWKPVP